MKFTCNLTIYVKLNQKNKIITCVLSDPKKWLLDVDSSGDPISFTIGVTWSTGSEDYGSVNVYKDPELTMQYPQRTFTVWTNSIIRFSGYDLTGFISNMSDYKFTIAHLDCPVSYVNETWISCTVPTTIPDVINYQDHSPVNMSIGNYQQQGFGQVHYRVPIFTDATDTYIDFDPSDLANRVTAMGHYLMVGLNHSSYRVQIGVGECSDVVVSTEMLTCRPPGTAPAPLAAFPLMGQLPQMVITVPKDSSEAVFQYTYHVTYIKYGNTTDENQPGLPSNGQVTAPNSNDDADDEPKVPGNDTSDSWKWIVVGVCAFVGVAFLTVLFCCLCCSDLCPIGKQRMRWVEKEPFYKVDTDSTRTPRSSIRSYQTRTSSGMYPTPSHLYYITQGQERL